jgi:HTH-type transcriptional regulator/antitoxin HigA
MQLLYKNIKYENQTHKEALSHLEDIFDSNPGTKEGDELELLSILIEKYEDEHFPIDAPDPIEAIKFRMEQMGLENKDLEGIIGSKGRVSEILNKKRKLTLKMIQSIMQNLHVPAEILLQDY